MEFTWLNAFPDGIKGLIYLYLRHPCAEMIAAGNLSLKYVYQQYLPLRIYDSLRPSLLGSKTYGTIQRIQLSVGEKNRLKRLDHPI